MDLRITTIAQTTEFTLPVTFIFWGYIVAYVIHLLDESLMGETFVVMLQKNFGPVEWRHFFIGNTLIMTLAITANIVYELFGHDWIIFPLSFVFFFFTNGIWHLAATIITKKYSPGLVSSILYWLLFYFILRYSILPGEISTSNSIISAVIGTLITILMIGIILVMRKKYFPKK